MSAYYDTTNAHFGLGTLIGTLGPFGPGAFSGSFQGPGPAGGTGLYSLTQVITLNTKGFGMYSGDFDITMVPEPASLVLLGGILLFTCGALRRKLLRNREAENRD